MFPSIDTNKFYAILLGVSNLRKYEGIHAPKDVADNIKELTTALKNKQMMGFSSSNIVQFFDEENNIKIKEHIITGSEIFENTFILYYTGHIVSKKNILYLTTPISTDKYIQVNGISLEDIVDILRESSARRKLLILDSYFTSDQDQEDIITNFLEKIRKNIEGMYIISSPTTINGSKESLQANPISFTKTFVKILQKGIKNNHDTITLKDMYFAIVDEFKKAGNQDQPFISQDETKGELVISLNNLHINFNKVIKRANSAFENSAFEKSLTSYKEARSLYQTEDIDQKIAFLSSFLEGEQYFKKNQFSQAKMLYEKAYNVIETDFAKEKLCTCMGHIAEDLYKSSKYDRAKIMYENLTELEPKNDFYQQKIIDCEYEINYNDLVDQGDTSYFKDDYQQAYKHYQQALEIRQDIKVLQRKDFCERFIEKEKKLEEKLTNQLKKQIRDEYIIEMKNQEKSKKKNENLKVKLTKEIEKKERENFENMFWTRASLWNTVDIYQLYLEFYADGKYVKKAKKRIEELKAKFNVDTKELSENKESEISGQITQDEDYPSEDIPEKENDFFNEKSEISDKKEENIISSTQTDIPTSTEQEEPNDIKTIDEEAIWNTAKEENTIEAYQIYLDSTEESKYAVDAFYMINKIKNKNLLESDADSSITTLQSSREKDQGISTPEKESNGEELEKHKKNEEEIWQKAHTKNTISAYYNYLNNTILKYHGKEARARISSLKSEVKNKEQEDWIQAQVADNIDAYKKYIKEYPLGAFYLKAVSKLKQLEDRGMN